LSGFRPAIEIDLPGATARLGDIPAVGFSGVTDLIDTEAESEEEQRENGVQGDRGARHM
jgi:hypothetical protein